MVFEDDMTQWVQGASIKNIHLDFYPQEKRNETQSRFKFVFILKAIKFAKDKLTYDHFANVVNKSRGPFSRDIKISTNIPTIVKLLRYE